MKHLIFCFFISLSLHSNEVPENVEKIFTAITLKKSADLESAIKNCSKSEINALNQIGEPSLFTAVRKNYPEAIKLLLEADADPSILNYNGRSLLELAVSTHENLVPLLLELGVSPNIVNGDNETLYFSAVRRKELSKVQQFFSYGVDIEKRNSEGHTPLIVALDRSYYSFCSYTEMVSLLINLGAKIDDESLSYQGINCLDTKRAGVQVIVDARKSASAPALPPEGEDTTSATCTFDGSQLLLAAEQNNLERVKAELKKPNANVNFKDSDGYNALHVAIVNKNEDLIDFLIDAGIDPNIDTATNDLYKNGTMIHFALITTKDNNQIVEKLIKKGADPTLAAQNLDNEPPLLFAAVLAGIMGNMELAKYLYDFGMSDPARQKWANQSETLLLPIAKENPDQFAQKIVPYFIAISLAKDFDQRFNWELFKEELKREKDDSPALANLYAQISDNGYIEKEVKPLFLEKLAKDIMQIIDILEKDNSAYYEKITSSQPTSGAKKNLSFLVDKHSSADLVFNHARFVIESVKRNARENKKTLVLIEGLDKYESVSLHPYFYFAIGIIERRYLENTHYDPEYFSSYGVSVEELAREALPEKSFYFYLDEHHLHDHLKMKGWDKRYLKGTYSTSSLLGQVERNDSMASAITDGFVSSDEVIVIAGGAHVPGNEYHNYLKTADDNPLTKEQFFALSKDNIAEKNLSPIRSAVWNVFEYIKNISYRAFKAEDFIE